MDANAALPEPDAIQQPVHPPLLDLAPPKRWRRFVPSWLRSLIWVDSAGSYDAFLSYSWKTESAVAAVLQSVIQTFLCPWYKLRAKTVFRDLSCLPASSSLEAELLDRLDRSKHLIVLASTGASLSQGMELEARHWFSRKQDGQVLVVVTGGGGTTWEEIRQQLLPVTVRNNLSTEPLWIPLEHRRREIDADPNGHQLRGELIEDLKQLLLRLYPDRDWGQLRGEERSQRRRAIGLMSGLALLFLMLALAAIGAAWIAQNQRAKAQQNERIAVARELVVSAQSIKKTDPELSLLLASRALAVPWSVNRTVVPEAEQALHAALLASRVRLTLPGHRGTVRGVAWSPDGTRLATASGDETVKVWDAAKGRELFALSGHRKTVASVAWSPDGKRMATAREDRTAKVWDAVSGTELITLRGHEDPVYSVAWSPDGKWLATGSEDQTARIWDAVTGKELFNLKGHEHGPTILHYNRAQIEGSEPLPEYVHGPVYCVAWSPDGNRLATASEDHTAKLWDTHTGKELRTLSGHRGAVLSVAWRPNGKTLVTASADGTLRGWEADTGRELASLDSGDALLSVMWSPDGKRLAASSRDKTVKVWEARTGDLLFTLSGHNDVVWSAAWSPDGTRLATGSADRTARVWNAGADADLLTITGHDEGVVSVAWSPNGQRLATGSADKTARVWNAATGSQLLTLSGHEGSVRSVAWSPDGTRLATGSRDGTAKLWDAASGHDLSTIKDQKALLWVAWSPDGQRLATASDDKTAKVWDAATSRQLVTLSGHGEVFGPKVNDLMGRMIGSVTSVAWSPDGKRLATGSVDRTARIWDAGSGKELLTLKGHNGYIYSVVWSPDGKELATGSEDHTAKIWDALTGKELFNLSGHGGEIYRVSWSPVGTRLATVSQDQTTKVWDVTTGGEVLTLAGHQDPVWGVAWSPDGKRLATTSRDATVRVYALDVSLLLSVARERATRNLAPAECRKYFHTDVCQTIP